MFNIEMKLTHVAGMPCGEHAWTQCTFPAVATREIAEAEILEGRKVDKSLGLAQDYRVVEVTRCSETE